MVYKLDLVHVELDLRILDLVHVEPILVELNTVDAITSDLIILGLNGKLVLDLILQNQRCTPILKTSPPPPKTNLVNFNIFWTDLIQSYPKM